MTDKRILNINEKDQVTGEIYRIQNIANGMYYIGQVVSHRLNKDKYRPFGYIGRFNDHISEAINNTKKKQCTYLNNAIRKYGKENFKVVFLRRCGLDQLDDLERHCIEQCKSLYPNGYNLTKGGKGIEHIKIENNGEMNKPKKRGRGFGFSHKDSTRQKMSERLKVTQSTDEVVKRTQKVMRAFYDNKKVEILKSYNLQGDVDDYVKPVTHKITGKVHDYVIRIGNKKLTVDSKNQSLKIKYNRLKSIILKVKTLQSENQCVVDDMIVAKGKKC